MIPLAQAGRHEVVLRYEAPGLKRGVAVTLASISAGGRLCSLPCLPGISTEHIEVSLTCRGSVHLGMRLPQLSHPT